MSREIKYQITHVDVARLRLEARYFYADAVDETGQPTWWVGPWSYDIPLDYEGKLVSMEKMKELLNVSCPVEALAREELRREMTIPSDYAETVGKSFKVEVMQPQAEPMADPLEGLLK